MSRREVRGVHPTEEELILATGGELPARRLAEVRAHLEVCWNCRTQAGNLEDTIRQFVSLRNRRIAELEPPTPAARSRFIGWMQQQPQASRHTPARFHLPRLGAPAFAIVFTALVLVAVIPYYLSHPPTVVSANELLRRAIASETRPALRRVRIRTPHRETIREVRTRREHVEAASLHPAPPPNDEIAVAFDRAGLDLENPLSAGAFERWRAGLHERTDEVTQGKTTFTLATSSSSGIIRQASLTVQASDFRPVEESFHLDDGGEVIISELGYQPMPETPAVNPAPAPAVAKSIRQPLPAPLPPPEPPVAAGPSENDLANAEVELRKQLHAKGLDTGHDWRIERTRTSVTLSGDSDATQGLAALPLVEYRAAALADTRPSGPAILIPQTAPSSPRRRAPLRSYLEKTFINESDREQYVAQTLDASQRLLAEAAALRQVAARYTPEEISLLGSESRSSLESLIKDYVAALRQYAAPSSQLLEATGEAAPVDQETASADWRECALSAFRAAQGVQQRVTWLLTEGPATEDQAPALLRELATYHAQLSSVLDALAVRTAGGFLQGEGR